MAREDAALARHISEFLPTLVEEVDAGELIRSLQAHPGYHLVSSILEAEISTINAEMERAREPMDQAQYAGRHGRIGGLRGFETAAETILARSDRRRGEQEARHEEPAESGSER